MASARRKPTGFRCLRLVNHHDVVLFGVFVLPSEPERFLLILRVGRPYSFQLALPPAVHLPDGRASGLVESGTHDRL